MARRVIWTEPALDDLDASAEFIARDSPRYAAAFVRRIRDASRTLTSMAERGRRVPEIRDEALRELLVGSHRLIYEVAGADVYILALVHGARDLEGLWESEPRSRSDE